MKAFKNDNDAFTLLFYKYDKDRLIQVLLLILFPLRMLEDIQVRRLVSYHLSPDVFDWYCNSRVCIRGVVCVNVIGSMEWDNVI